MNGILDKSKEKKVKVPTCLEKKTKLFHKKMIQNCQAQGISLLILLQFFSNI